MKQQNDTSVLKRLKHPSLVTMLQLEKKTSRYGSIWALGIPLDRRAELEALLPGRINFITVKQSLGERAKRILSEKNPCFLIWPNADQAVDHNEFVQKHNIAVLMLDTAECAQDAVVGKQPAMLESPVPSNTSIVPTMAVWGITCRNEPSHQVTAFDDRLQPGTLTCILPYRYSPERADFEERMQNPLLDPMTPRNLSFLLVDDGSTPEMSEINRNICHKLGYSYLYVDTADQEFSVGRCRNVGAQYARSEFIFMQDIDLMPYQGFYNDLLNEIEIQGMRENAKHFLMVPYVFLSQEGTQAFIKTSQQSRRQAFVHHAIIANEQMVDKVSVGTSANVYNRLWYLSRGGNSPDFEGWGYEDLEFNTRMIRHLQLFPIPREWALEKFNFNSVVEWRSYKASYRLFGDLLMMKGIALFHAWHPISDDTSYMEKREVNREIFIKKIAEFPKNGKEPEPLPDIASGTSLLFRTNAFTQGRIVRPLLGRLLHMPDETQIDSAETLKCIVAEFGIDRIIFFNPYQTPHMLKVYHWARELGIPYFVAERGALPASNFFDPGGFLLDSDSYNQSRWDRPLTQDQETSVVRYIDSVRTERPALEEQPTPIGGKALRDKLGIKDSEKMIFISLQRPGDTVTRFFHREVSYQQYLEQIQEVCSKILPGVTICVKKHPLEDDSFAGASYINVDNENIYDLLEACDAVWTFNSGVGILAMLYSKPVLLSGAAFYSFENINIEINSTEDALSAIRDLMAVDQTKVSRFIHYLIAEMYSFGSHRTKKVKMPDGQNMTATLEIDYTNVRIGKKACSFVNRSRAALNWNSILFDRYRAAEKALKN